MLVFLVRHVRSLAEMSMRVLMFRLDCHMYERGCRITMNVWAEVRKTMRSMMMPSFREPWYVSK
jgi:hypothetical protein